MTDLSQIVKNAVERLQMDGLDGWGLNNPDPETFDMVTTGPAYGCTSQTCNHFSHDPAASTTKLVPRTGKFVSLGHEQLDNELHVEYLLLSPQNRFFCLREPRAMWSSLKEINANDMPDWAIASLAKGESNE